jgi:hypothetical protein
MKELNTFEIKSVSGGYTFGTAAGGALALALGAAGGVLAGLVIGIGLQHLVPTEVSKPEVTVENA